MDKSKLLEVFRHQQPLPQPRTSPLQTQTIEWSTERLDRMYSLPANRKEANIHRQASKFGYKVPKIVTDGGQEIVPVCPCCNNLVATYQIPLEYPTTFKSQTQAPNLLPPQSLIYFLFVKLIIGLMITRFIICDFYVLWLSGQGRYCSNLNLLKSMQEKCAVTFSAMNLQSSEDQDKFVIIDLLCILFTIASLVLLVMFDRQVKVIFNSMVNHHETPQKSFVKSYKLTQFVTNQQKRVQNSHQAQKMDLQTFLKTAKHPDQQDAVQDLFSVNLSYNPAVFQTIQKQRLLYKDSIEMQMEINKKYVEICKYYTTSKDKIFYLTNFNGKISLTKSHSLGQTRDHFQVYERKIKDYFDGQVQIQPSNQTAIHVNWQQDTHLQRSGHINKNLLAMLIFLVFFCLLGLQRWKIQQRITYQSRPMRILITIVAIFITMVSNRSLSSFIIHLANKEKYQSIRQKRLDLFYCTMISQFCIIVLLSGIVYFIYPTNKLGDTGLIIKMMGVIGLNGVSSNLLSFFIPVIIQKCKGCFMCCQGAQIQGFQKQINKQHELNEFKYWQRYIFYIVHLFLVAFYGILIPAATPFLIIIFICQYWIDKYNLFKRSSLSHQNAQCISFLYQACFRLIYFAILVFAGSHWGWGNEINYDHTLIGNLKTINVMIVLAFLLYFKKRTKVQQSFGNTNVEGQNKQDYGQNSYLYYKNQNLIVKTYQNQNPITFCRKHKLSKLTPSQGAVTIQCQNGNFIKESEFDKYLNLYPQQMLFPLWDFNENRYRWVKVTDLAVNLGRLAYQPKVSYQIW